jgi:hypothetical protein
VERIKVRVPLFNSHQEDQMLRISKETTLKPEDVIKKSIGFFGPGGNNMKVASQAEGCISFEGGGGTVSLTIQPSGKKNSVEIITQEWEEPVKEFMRRLKTG